MLLVVPFDFFIFSCQSKYMLREKRAGLLLFLPKKFLVCTLYYTNYEGEHENVIYLLQP